VKVYHFPDGRGTAQYLMLMSDLLDAPIVHTGEWQSMSTGGSAPHATHELEDVSLVWERLPQDLDEIIPAIDQSWADDHYIERISGNPMNPAPSHLNWPYAVRNNGDHTNSGQFDHTYPERFWPKHAGHGHNPERYASAQLQDMCGGRAGIRFHYGDLRDVVNLLVRSPLTRQAFLPVWFPEDTGAVDGQRVPCTIGYHFMQRRGRLSCRYYIRSCDAYRHLSNDVWLAAMLTKWVADQVNEATKDRELTMRFRLGGMVMHISSLHAFKGDRSKIADRMEKVAK
jgi:hypothetical protein